MFGFLAAFGPVGIAAAVVGTVGAAIVANSSSSSGSSSNRREVQDNYDESKKDQVCKDIEAYEKNSIKRIKNKYDIDIEFEERNPSSSHGNDRFGIANMFHTIKKDQVKIVSKNTVIENEIKKLKKETDEIIKLIAKLRIEKHETIG